MASLEDLTQEQQEQALRLFSFVKQNPEIEKSIRREAKKKFPNMAAPDLDLEEALAKQREEFETKFREQEEKATAQMLQQRRADAHSKIREAGLEPDEVEKLMETEAIGSYDTAIKYARAQKSLAPPTPEAVTPMSLPSGKELWADKNKFARSAAFEAINELKASRGFGR
jgi:hypothetical protein